MRQISEHYYLVKKFVVKQSDIRYHVTVQHTALLK
jgi:hypothetical protein